MINRWVDNEDYQPVLKLLHQGIKTRLISLFTPSLNAIVPGNPEAVSPLPLLKIQRRIFLKIFIDKTAMRRYTVFPSAALLISVAMLAMN